MIQTALSINYIISQVSISKIKYMQNKLLKTAHSTSKSCVQTSLNEVIVITGQFSWQKSAQSYVAQPAAFSSQLVAFVLLTEAGN